MASIFSRIVSGEIPAYVVAENEQFLAFLDIFPLQKGHTLVIPKREIDNVFDLSDSELAGLTVFAKMVAHKIKKAIPCQRIGMTVIGLEVPHAHIHLIPINREKDMNFSNPKLKLSEETFKDVASAIKNA